MDKHKSIIYDRILGCIFGQAIGDALGLGTEFMSICEVKRHYPYGLCHYSQIIQDHHRSRWQKGSWTDDTDMMLCIADAIIEDKGKIDYLHIARNFKTWYNGSPMGIGSHTNKVLCLKDYVENPIKAAELIWRSSRCKSASNGALMRTSILGIIGDPVLDAERICKLTHADPRCIGSCVIVSILIHSIIYMDKLLSLGELIKIGERYSPEIKPYIQKSTQCDLSELFLFSETDMGYTLKTLSVAIWAAYQANSFEEGLLSIVNAGGDADTNAAVACSILGARYGFANIPTNYISGLIGKDRLEMLCKTLISIIS